MTPLGDDVARFAAELERERLLADGRRQAEAQAEQQIREQCATLCREAVALLRQQGQLPLRRVPVTILRDPRPGTARRGWRRDERPREADVVAGPATGEPVWPLFSRDLAASGQDYVSPVFGITSEGVCGTLLLDGRLTPESPQWRELRARELSQVAAYCRANGLRGAYEHFSPRAGFIVPVRVHDGTLEAEVNFLRWVPLSDWLARSVAETLAKPSAWMSDRDHQL